MRRFLTTRSPRLSGGLHDVLAAGAIDDDTVLRRRPGQPLRAARTRRPHRRAAGRPLDRRARVVAARPGRPARAPRARPTRPRRAPRPAESPRALPPPRAGRDARGRLVTSRDPAFRCAIASDQRDEPMTGTASTVRAFLLVEHPGPWGVDALRDARLPDGLGDSLKRAAAAAKVRPLLVRRPDRRTGRGRHPGLRSLRAPVALVDRDDSPDRSAPAARSRPRRVGCGALARPDPVRRNRSSACAPTAATTPAAPSAAGRSPRHWPRRTRGDLGGLAHRRRPLRRQHAGAPRGALLRPPGRRVVRGSRRGPCRRAARPRPPPRPLVVRDAGAVRRARPAPAPGRDPRGRGTPRVPAAKRRADRRDVRSRPAFAGICRSARCPAPNCSSSPARPPATTRCPSTS